MVTTVIPSLIRDPRSLVILRTGILLSLLSFVSSDDHIWAAIPMGSKLSPAENRTWVSPEGTFAMGFYPASGQADEYSVGIWFNSIPAEARTMIWTAGEDLKVRLNASLELTMDGNLVLFDYLHGVPAWTSKTSDSGVVGAVLRDNGNLVLSDSSNKTIWESFETPSDTLVPGQRLHVGQTLRAASRKSTSSYYNLLMERTGNLALKWESNVSYWDSGTESLPSDSIPIGAMFAGDGAFVLFDSRGRTAWNRYSNDYTDTKVVLRYLRLDVDGNLRMYSWIQESQSWKSGWQAVENQCDVFATCGVYGVCSFNSMGSVCECPFEGSSDATMESNDPGNGCRKLVPLGGCKEGGGVTMHAMEKTVLYGLYPPHDVLVNTSSEKCKEQCLNDDLCVAATAMNDGSGLCKLKRTEFISGYTYGSVAAVSFLKKCLVPEAVPSQIIPRGTGQSSSSPASSSASNLSHGSAPGICRVCLVGASLGTLGAFIVIEVGVGLCILKKRRRGKALQSGKLALLNTTNTGTLIRLSFSEVQELTRNFKEKLASSVYKGVLSNNKAVAIKQFNMEVGEKHLRMTLSTLGSIHHRNLVQLQGFCCESKHRFLVYEYISNGSLAQWLFGGSTKKQAKRLTWQRRLGIATGIARAISYLHSECRECIPHGNLKLENVLLDDEFTAKVTDFGLGKLKEGSISLSSSESSPERDVFRFGEMLLEIITGKRERDSCETDEKSNTNSSSSSSVCRWSWGWAYQEYQMGHLESIADCRMEGNVEWNEIERALKIALWCMQEQSFSRPSMNEVVKVLDGTLQVDPPPIFSSPHGIGTLPHHGDASCSNLPCETPKEAEGDNHAELAMCTLTHSGRGPSTQ